MPSPSSGSKSPTPRKRTTPASTKKEGTAASAPAPEAKPVEPPKPVETLSLIDDEPKKPRVPSTKPKTSMFPPISKIKAAAQSKAKPAPEPTPAPAALPPPPPKPVVLDLIGGKPERKPAPAPAPAPEPAAPEPAPSAESGASTPPPPAAPVAAAAPEGEPDGGEPAADKIVHIKPPIVVKALGEAMGLKAFQVIKDLMSMGIFANQNQTVEPDVAAKVCTLHGYTFEVEKREKGAGVHKPEPKVLEPVAPVPVVVTDESEVRAPIVTFMGHVDHGKTSLMDAIRKTRVAAGEAGGITQHIGAYRVEANGRPITFLDTPGHAAFTAMRARGAKVTDIVVLVVAADDGMMPQTIEAMNHAKAAGVKIVVALNKIDLASANPDRVKAQLQQHDLAPVDWGGNTEVCPVSATKGLGIDHLLEVITLEAELMELKANPKEPPRGTVVEAQVEAGRGPTATVIVQRGTLKAGHAFICGRFWGKVKAMLDDRNKPVKEAGPSVPVKIVGFSGLPNAGDELVFFANERDARELSEQRLEDIRTKKLAPPQRASLESLMSLMQGDGKKVLKLVLKCDVQGSQEALVASLNEIKSKKVELEFVHTGVGPITESDVLLASASQAVIIGFNTKLESVAVSTAKREGVQVKLYSIIYELIDQVKDAMAGLLDPETRESIIGHAEVRQVFDLTKGRVAGCYVTDGRIMRSGRARVLRRRQAVYDGGLATLRRFQDDVKEVRANFECGIKLGDYDDYEVGDIIECYTLEKVAQKL
ncbi:MAG: translation initiation factor IF-2 [Verrucomicrobia bacterium]|nr:translation initiation factor IF-2 [Verrucomicrobiota bacterium]